MNKEIESFPLNCIKDKKAFNKWVHSLKKIDSLKLHEHLIVYDEIIKIRESKEKYKYIDQLPYSLQREEKSQIKIEHSRESERTILDIQVGSKKRRSAYIIMNQLLKGIEKLGGSVYVGHEKAMNTELVLNNICWKVKLKELSMRRNADNNKSMQPAHGRVPSGILQLEIQCLEGKETNVYSDQDEAFSKQLINIFENIRLQYIHYRDVHIEKERKKEIEAKLRAQQEETKRLEEEAKKIKTEISERREQLKEEVFQHKTELEKLLEINEYVEKLKQVYKDSEDLDAVIEYIENVQQTYNLENFVSKLKKWNGSFFDKNTI